MTARARGGVQAEGGVRIDWPGLMRAGLHGLGLAPGAFWCLTPCELRLMLGAGAGAAPLSRSRFDELARAFPDRGSDNGGKEGMDGE